jgi:hypothetical protein
MNVKLQWFVRDGNKTQGPFTQEELQLLAKNGKISDACELSSPTLNNGEWCGIEILPGLADLINVDDRKFLMLKSGNYAATKAEKPAARDRRPNQSASVPGWFSWGRAFGVLAILLALVSYSLYQRPVWTIVCAACALVVGTIGFFASASSGGKGIRYSIGGIILSTIGLILGGIALTLEAFR